MDWQKLLSMFTQQPGAAPRQAAAPQPAPAPPPQQPQQQGGGFFSSLFGGLGSLIMGGLAIFGIVSLFQGKNIGEMFGGLIDGVKNMFGMGDKKNDETKDPSITAPTPKPKERKVSSNRDVKPVLENASYTAPEEKETQPESDPRSMTVRKQGKDGLSFDIGSNGKILNKYGRELTPEAYNALTFEGFMEGVKSGHYQVVTDDATPDKTPPAQTPSTKETPEAEKTR